MRCTGPERRTGRRARVLPAHLKRRNALHRAGAPHRSESARPAGAFETAQCAALIAPYDPIAADAFRGKRQALRVLRVGGGVEMMTKIVIPRHRQLQSHSITSSARRRKASEMVRSMAFAVLRLTASVKRVGN